MSDRQAPGPSPRRMPGHRLSPRLTIVTGIYHPARGGSERAALRLIAAWREAGHDVHLLGGGYARARALALAREIVRQLRAAPADILFLPGQTYATVGAMVRARLGAATPPIVTKVSNMPPAGGPGGEASRLWLKIQSLWTRRFIAPCPASAERLVAGGLPGRRVVAAANALIDAHRLAVLAPSGDRTADGTLRLLTVGRLVPQKAHHRLIAAFARIARPDDRLTIVGGGPLRAALERQARATGKDIRFSGAVDDPTPLYHEANGFALTSRFEGMPAVLAEALAAGLPIVATDSAPGIASLIGGLGGNSIVGDSLPELAHALESLRAAKVYAEAHQQRARLYTGTAAGEAYIHVLSDVVRETRPRPASIAAVAAA